MLVYNHLWGVCGDGHAFGVSQVAIQETAALTLVCLPWSLTVSGV